jgi:hypothetical protein
MHQLVGMGKVGKVGKVGKMGKVGKIGKMGKMGKMGKVGEDGEGGESEEGVCLHRDAPHKHAPAGAGLLNHLPPSAIAYS